MTWLKHFLKPWMLFLMASLLVATSLPRQVFFRFEYQVGRPWMHPKLEAPFDFALPKTRLELKKQKEELQHTTWVVFRADSLTERRMREAWNKTIQASLDSLPNQTSSFLSMGLDSLLERGIFAGFHQDIPTEVVQVLTPTQKLITRLKERLIPLTEAANWPNSWPNSWDSLTSQRLKKSFDQLLEPNLFLDSDWSERLRRRAMESLPNYQGIILQGELLIDQGEMVTPESFWVINSLKLAYQKRQFSSLQGWGTLLGQWLFVSIWLAFLYAYFHVFRPVWLKQPKKLLALLTLLCFHVLLVRLAGATPGGHIYMAPAVMFPILIRALFDSRTAIFSLLTFVLICAYFAPNSFEYVLLQLAGGLIAVFSFKRFRKRAQLFSLIAMLLVVWSFMFLTLHLLRAGEFFGLDWFPFLSFFISGVATLFTFALVYITEKVFGLHSDFTLLELSDMNNPLLKELSQKAPGTFQHSIQVANLAEAAAEISQGNSLLVHTAALYHDIGKLKQPGFFAENILGSDTPHKSLSFEQSAGIIIRHVDDGVQLARKHKLPEVLVDFIRTHHGTSTVQYFYRNYLENFPNDSEVRHRFSYPGPKPFSKETGILMMADSVEAASRSLKEKTAENLENLVDKIIDYQMADGQLNHTSLTLNEIRKIKEVFKAKLLNMYHQRIAYPEMPSRNAP